MAIRNPYLTMGTHRTAPLPIITCPCCKLRRRHNERHVSADNIARCSDCIAHYARPDEGPEAEGERAIAHEPHLRAWVRQVTEAANRMERERNLAREKVGPALRSRDEWRKLATDAVRLHSSQLNGCECGTQGKECPTERQLFKRHRRTFQQAVGRNSPDWGLEESDLEEY